VIGGAAHCLLKLHSPHQPTPQSLLGGGEVGSEICFNSCRPMLQSASRSRKHKGSLTEELVLLVDLFVFGFIFDFKRRWCPHPPIVADTLT
jgi:hypothetical protein